MPKVNKQLGGDGDDVVLHIDYPARPRKEPRQARSIAMVNALRQTGRRILEEEGRDALTLFNLSESSGVSTSSIYEYFPSMEALIAVIFEDLRQEARVELLSGLAALAPSARLYDGLLFSIRLGLKTHCKRLQLAPDFCVRAACFDELVRLDLVKAQQVWTACVAPALLERFPDEVCVQDTQKAMFLAYQTLILLPRAMLLENPDYLHEEGTAELITRMVHALLTQPSH
ncbi:TetR family transcriptional regulator [Pseudomonas sp. NPDC090755]|uniref:TetR family transcriptional regulator n=1 Tax=Pseudomonas sp. NPDC090755 TaxID=3364481 RepID=UPI00383B93D1